MTHTRTEHWWALVGDKSGTVAVLGRSRPRKLPGFKLRRATVSWDEPERCEICGKPAKHHDIEGTPLCGKCWRGLLNDRR